MKYFRFILVPAVAGLLLTAPVHADTLGTAIGGGVGAVAGAVIGDSVGGRNAMLIGSGVGGALGAVVGQSVSRTSYPQSAGYGAYDDGYGRHGRPPQIHHHHHHYHEKKRHGHGHGHAYGHYKKSHRGWHD